MRVLPDLIRHRMLKDLQNLNHPLWHNEPLNEDDDYAIPAFAGMT